MSFLKIAAGVAGLIAVGSAAYALIKKPTVTTVDAATDVDTYMVIYGSETQDAQTGHYVNGAHVSNDHPVVTVFAELRQQFEADNNVWGAYQTLIITNDVDNFVWDVAASKTTPYVLIRCTHKTVRVALYVRIDNDRTGLAARCDIAPQLRNALRSIMPVVADSRHFSGVSLVIDHQAVEDLIDHAVRVITPER